jgi:hypothetical protein
VRTIEWPKNSGRTAVYDDDELEQIAAIIAAGKESGIPSARLSEDLLAVHTFKVELGARLIGDLPLPAWVPPVGDPFRPPDHVLAELRLDLSDAA